MSRFSLLTGCSLIFSLHLIGFAQVETGKGELSHDDGQAYMGSASVVGDSLVLLTPEAHQRIVSCPPEQPERFARLVLELEFGGSGKSELYDAVLDRVLKFFLEASRNAAGGDPDSSR